MVGLRSGRWFSDSWRGHQEASGTVSRCEAPAGTSAAVMMAMELIGRMREVAEVVERLADRRLVTLIGPAGIGKTALARVGDAAWSPQTTSSAPTRGPDPRRLPRTDVPGTIAGQLGFPSFEAMLSSPDRAAGPARGRQLRARHGGRGRCRRRAARRRASRPAVLATSRSPLDLPGESLVVLGPLGVPPRAATPTPTPTRCGCSSTATRDAGAAVADEQLAPSPAVPAARRRAPRAGAGRGAAPGRWQPAEILGTAWARAWTCWLAPRFRGARPASQPRRDGRLVLPAAAAGRGRAVRPARRVRRDRSPRSWPVPSAATPVSTRGRPRRALALLVDSSLVVADTAGQLTRFRLLETVRMFALRRLRRRGDRTTRPSIASSTTSSRRPAASIDGRRPPLGPGGRSAGCWACTTTPSRALRWCLAHDDDGEPRAFTLLRRAVGGGAPGSHRRDRRALRARRWPAGPTAARRRRRRDRHGGHGAVPDGRPGGCARAGRGSPWTRPTRPDGAGDCCAGRWPTPPGPSAKAPARA